MLSVILRAFKIIRDFHEIIRDFHDLISDRYTFQTFRYTSHIVCHHSFGQYQNVVSNNYLDLPGSHNGFTIHFRLHQYPR